MRILVINAGSSSVKFSVFDMTHGEQCFKSEIERVGVMEDALREIPRALENAGQQQLDAIGHRVAHGGSLFRDATLINEDVVDDIEACVPLAPLHNPPILAGIKMTRKLWPLLPQVAVFDTAFHQNIPEYAYTYAVPKAWRDAGLRRYGFHGTSHRYIMERVTEELRTPAARLRIISCHLGNGASICAIQNGVSIDTSMGMTPLEGLVMGTRSGDVDPGIFTYLERTLGLSADQVENALYHDSGLAALSGCGNDMRDIEKQVAAGDAKAQLALEVHTYRVKKYIGAYAAAMDGVDAIAFTGGIGENSALIRSRICNGLEFLGLQFDEAKNAQVKLTGYEAPQIQRDSSQVRVLVTQAREQWMIAKETARIAA
ncbi:MAG TPA: acetate kinase [Rickettsiales bacterium]|nr:acetate kinase [Rickettsiales bacterium]